MDFQQQGRSSAQTIAIAIAMAWAARGATGDALNAADRLANLRDVIVEDLLKNAPGHSALSDEQWAVMRSGFDAEFGRIVELVGAITEAS
ncbi:hypothetical protein D9M72_68860 [compost metagenome]